MQKPVSDMSTSLISGKTPLEAFPVASLFVTHGEMAGREVPLSRETFFIGRSASNNLAFSDKSVSRKHAVINAVGGEYVISDLDSLRGVFVNGRKVKEEALSPGDVINIGENRMQFRMLTPSGSWLAPGSRRGFWLFFLLLMAGVLAGGGGWFAYQKYAGVKASSDVAASIRDHYNRGIELFNREHDIPAARVEWKKILELDPLKKTDFANKAEALLKSTGGQ
jgi:hypothetical protein